MSHHPKHPQHDRHRRHAKRTGLHRDWRTWTVVVLMLAAMAMYVLTLDESVGPEGVGRPAIENADAE